MAATKARLITSAELYTAVLNDPYVFNHRVRIGYMDARRHRLVYAPLTSWRPVDEGGDVPWTRVFTFLYDDRILWDRETRVCNLREIHDENKSLAKLPFGRAHVCTLNMFRDRSKASPFAARRDALLEFVDCAVTKFEFVALQEVPEAALPLLKVLAERHHMHMCSTEGVEDVEDHLALLTRFAIVDSSVVKLNRSKAVLLADVFLEDMRSLRLAVVHLTSSAQAHAASKRSEQLLTVTRHTPGDHVIVLGDFNDRERVQAPRFRDAHDVLAPEGDAAHSLSSYLPGVNPWATGSPGALDKVLVSKFIAPVSLLVDRSVVVSDHFPLIAELDVSDIPVLEDADELVASAHGRTDAKSALCIVLPYALWEPLRTWSGVHESADQERWMPHVSIAAAFVPEEEFFTIQRRLQAVVEEFLPLAINFSDVTVLHHDASHSVVLAASPETLTSLRLLYNAIRSVVPISHSGEKDGHDYTPHITLSKCSSEHEASSLARRLQGVAAVTFTCSRLHMVSRAATPYMRVMNWLGTTDNDSVTMRCIFDRLFTSIRVIGSSMLTLADPTAWHDALQHEHEDLDLQAICRPGIDLLGTQRLLETCGEFTLVKNVTNAHGKYLQLHRKLPNKPIDIHVEEGPSHSVTGMDVVLQRVDAAGLRTPFVACLTAVKRGLRACGVYGQRYGFLPGYGVAIMVLKLLSSLQEHRELPDAAADDDWLRQFCSRYSSSLPLRVCASGRVFGDMSARHIAVQNLLPPGDNIVRTATSSSAAKLHRALISGCDPRAVVRIERSQLPWRTTLHLFSMTLQQHDGFLAYFSSKFLSLVLKLERGQELLSHDDGWTSEASSDYPFAASFTFTSATALPSTDAMDAVLTPLQVDASVMFPGCVLTFEHS